MLKAEHWAAISSCASAVAAILALWCAKRANDISEKWAMLSDVPVVEVSVDYPFGMSGPGEPFVHVKVENFSGVELSDVELYAIAYGTEPDVAAVSTPLKVELKTWPSLPPRERQLLCIDTELELLVKALKVSESSAFAPSTEFVDLCLDYRIRETGRPFKPPRVHRALKRWKGLRPMLVVLEGLSNR